MTTNHELANFLDDLNAEERTARVAAVRSIKAYDVERANEKQAKAAKDKHANVLREFFKTHPDEAELTDQEWGLRAYMQKGGRTLNYEHPNVIFEQNPKLFGRLATLGLLRLDGDAIEKALAEGLLTHGDLAGYVHEGERSPSLQVKDIKRVEAET